MTEQIDIIDQPKVTKTTVQNRDQAGEIVSKGVPSNPVYARVGDTILRAARDGVRRNLPPRDIVREILEQHDVRLNVGELRLLLASRRLPVTQTS